MIPAVCRLHEVCARGRLTDERRALREELRLQAAERFRQGDENTVITHDLRVSVRSVQRWRKAWSQDGPTAPPPALPPARACPHLLAAPVPSESLQGEEARPGGARRTRAIASKEDQARRFPTASIPPSRKQQVPDGE